MISDDERRKIAARLRGLDYADLQESLICAYLDALGIEGYADWVGIAHRLADLIEPVERMCLYYDADTNHCGCYDTRLIDRDALLALADEIEGTECVMRCCNDASAGVMFVALDHERIARRIREACGEAGR